MTDIATPHDACREFGDFLGVGEPVPPAALRAALADPAYARKLLSSRGSLDAVRHLLARPPAPPNERHPISDTQLVLSATKALARWVMGGLKRVDDATYARRMAACRSCVHLRTRADEDSSLYALVGAAERETCGLCGCIAANKARLPTESCPALDPSHPGLSRWGE